MIIVLEHSWNALFLEIIGCVDSYWISLVHCYALIISYCYDRLYYIAMMVFLTEKTIAQEATSQKMSVALIHVLFLFFISNFIFRVKVRVVQQVYVFKAESIELLSNFHFDRPVIKATNSLLLPISALICPTQLSCAKDSCGEIQLQ